MRSTPSRSARLARAATVLLTFAALGAGLAACGGPDDAADDTTSPASGFGPARPDSAAAAGGVDSMAPSADISGDTVRDSMPRP